MIERLLRDGLTGLPNLIALADELRELPAGTGALALVDLRGLSGFNRDHGTGAGDSAIRLLGAVLAGAAAEPGTAARVYRTGGDEFVVHLAGLPDSAAAAAAGVASLAAAAGRYRRQLEELGLPQVAFGYSLACYPEEGSTLAALLPLLHGRLQQQQGATARAQDGWVEDLLAWFVRRLDEAVDALRMTQEMAMTDLVSGLSNHRAAELELQALAAKHLGGGEGFAVLFVDGDRLKAYNELLGYEAGNEMIRLVGGTLAASVRRGDFVGRWLSGDEFIVLLPGAAGTEALAAAERLREAVAGASEAWPLPVTVSIGVAACPEHGVAPGELVRAAAAASQRAKERGRNRTVLAAGGRVGPEDPG